MADLLELLKKNTKKNWLIGYDSQKFYCLVENIYYNLQSNYSQPVKTLIVDNNKINFLAYFLALSAAKFSVFLGNCDWKQSEWEQVLNLVKPALIWEDNSLQKTQYFSLKNQEVLTNNHVMIPTGGSSGQIKFTIHSWKTLIASVTAFQEFFKLNYINSFCILPVDHVSGLMQFLRCFFSGGKFAIFDYSLLKKNIYSEVNVEDYFISLVPTQLQFLLENNPQWLAKFKTVLLGGAPPWKSLLETARQHKINLAPTYGMTETASGITILKPQFFLKGNNSSGQILPNNKIEITENNVIKIFSNSLFLGYYPNFNNTKCLITDDLGYFDEQNCLHIIGRNSRKIISGGENICPEEIENTILATGLVNDVCVIGIEDKNWGELVTAIYVSLIRPTTTIQEVAIQEQIKTKIKEKLSKYKIPKKWIQVTKIPRNKQGKINFELLKSSLVKPNK
jgi:O-succinylbenzoic acid--CoA ligase